tara:strand:- start:12 stop:452 length:441 start_codon:yes stop_codon:yes gene_type:complete
MASGKSTLFKALSKNLRLASWVLIDRETLKNPENTNSKEISKKKGFLLVQNAIYHDKNILCQEYHPHPLKALVQDCDYQIFDFFLTCSVETALQRNKVRKKRFIAPDHRVNYWHEKAKPTPNSIIISTETASVEECCKQILNELGL